MSQMSVSSGATLLVNFNETVQGLQDGTGGGSVVLGSGAVLESLGNAYDGDFDGIISGPGSITVSDGQQGFSGNNTYSGGTLISGTGVVSVGSNTALGTGAVTFNGLDPQILPDADATLANAIVLDSALDNEAGTSNLTLTGLITGTGGIDWNADNTLALTHANTFTGGVDMSQGILLLGNNTAAGTGQITLSSNVILSAFGGPGTNLTVSNDIEFEGSPTQIGNADNNYITLSGTVGGETSLTYDGGSTGTLTLTGSNNGLSGPITITSGTVIAGNDFAFGSSGNNVTLTGGAGINVETGITVNNPLNFSGTANIISGSGTIGSTVTADSTVVISPTASPGNGPGNLTFSGGVTFATGGTLNFSIYDATGSAGTGYSLITAPGGLDITASPGTFVINVNSVNSAGGAASAINFSTSGSYSWMIATASSPVTGFSASDFDIVSSAFANSPGTTGFSVSQTGDDLFLNFTPVPEPSTWALITGGVGALLVPFFLKHRKLARVR